MYPYHLIYVPFVSTLVLFYMCYSATAIMLIIESWLFCETSSLERCGFNSLEDLILKVYLQ